MSDTSASPFGSALAFLPVAYSDQFAGPQAPVPQPTVGIPLKWQFAQDADGLPAAGITLELWFNAQSSGVLIGENFSVPMKGGTFPILVPLLYIDGNGQLRGGLFDGTALTPPATPTTPWSSQVSNGPSFIGAANSIASPGSVIDGDWHHAALVVTPAADGAAGRQSLFLDGRLVATATGTFSLANLAQGLQSLGLLQLGGTIIPEPYSEPLPALTYPQGFEGTMDEIRVWAGARTQSQIQLMMDQPLGTDDIAQCLVYVGVDDGNNYASASISSTPPQPVLLVLPQSYLQTVPSQVPFDPFTTVTTRLTGCENYGLFLATHFSAPAMAMTFAPSQACSLKVGLRLCDVLLIAFPTEAGGDDLSGTFTLTVTEGNTQQSQTVGPFQPGASYWLTAGRTGIYRLDFTYVCNAATTIGMQFQVIPAAASTLMQTLLYFDQATTDQPSNPPLLMAYTDPNYPILPAQTADPRQPSAQVTEPAYWPLFSDPTVFPASPNYSADDLLAAYLNLVQSTPLNLQGGTFADYRNLLTNGATTVDPAELSAALQSAYTTFYNAAPPALPADASTYGPGPYATAEEAVYAFLFNANFMRTSINAFLDNYCALIQANINTLSAIDVAQEVATAIYTEQAFKDLLAVTQMSKGGFFVNLFGQAVMWGIGAALALFAPPLGAAFALTEAGIAALGTGISAVGSAAASVGSELLGTFVASSATKISLPASFGSYSTLLNVANNVTSASNAVWDNMLALLQDPVFRQHIFSNYGLLQALQAINAAGIAELASSSDSTIPHNPLVAGYTYATWQALVPAAFSWKQETDASKLYLPDPVSGVSSHPPYVAGSVLFSKSASMQTEMLQTAYQLQQGGKSSGGHPAPFVTMSACRASPITWLGAIIAEWYLVDRTGKPIVASLAQSLFGAGTQPLKLIPVDPDNNFAALGGGWYFNATTPAGAVTTWYDVFVNWAEAAPAGYSPGILIPQPPTILIFNSSAIATYVPVDDEPPAVNVTG